MVESLIGCVAGAVLVDETRAMAEAAGLVEIQLTPKSGYVDAMMDWNDPLYRKIIEHLPAGAKAGDYVTSLEVAAKKAEGPASGAGEKSQRVYTPAVGELVAIGAAIAANCEACFKYHYAQAQQARRLAGGHGLCRDDGPEGERGAGASRAGSGEPISRRQRLGRRSRRSAGGHLLRNTGSRRRPDIGCAQGDSARRAGKASPGGKSCCS